MIEQNSWSDITLEDYKNINNIKNNSSSEFSKMLEVLCYLTDDDSWEEEDINIVVKNFKNLHFLRNEEYKEVNIDGYILKPITKFNISEWIDYDKSITEDDYNAIIALKLRKFKTDEWGNIEFEPYKFSLSSRKQTFDDLTMDKVFTIIREAKKDRETLLNSFREIFEHQEENLSDEEKKELTPAEISQIEMEIENDNQKRQFSWQILLDNISNGDWSRIPDILELPIGFVLNMMLVKKRYG